MKQMVFYSNRKRLNIKFHNFPFFSSWDRNLFSAVSLTFLYFGHLVELELPRAYR